MGDRSYYYYLEEKDTVALDEESLVTLLREKEKGVLLLRSLPGTQVEYDAYTGEVTLSSIEVKSGITHYYSLTAFESYIKPILDALNMLAKYQLLLLLTQLGDGTIADIIHKNHGELNVNLSQSAINKTLIQIQDALKPVSGNVFFFRDKPRTEIQKSVYMMLYSYNIDEIHSRS